MAKLNKVVRVPRVLQHTHGGAVATRESNPSLKLRRLVMANMLWEDQFYLDGESTVTLIKELVPQVHPADVAAIAITAREKGKLRHVPLLLVRELARQFSLVNTWKKSKHGGVVPVNYLKDDAFLVASTLEKVIQRPDELAEFLSIYWKEGKVPLSAQVKKGLARAFAKFSEYQLAKYDGEGSVKLRDVMFLTHPNPNRHPLLTKKGSISSRLAEQLYKRIANRELKTPDTWEVALSAGADKKETFTRLLQDGKLGGLALLRNLRNMQEAGVDETLVKLGIREMNTERVLPFRFISAARFAPQLQPHLEEAMFKSLADHPPLKGRTLLLVDISGSMESGLSGKSDLTRMDAAAALAMLLKEIGEDVVIETFSISAKLVPNRRGFALRDAIVNNQPHGGTDLGGAVTRANTIHRTIDRLIVLTDEQSQSAVPEPRAPLAYMINVAAYQNGVGVKGQWDRVDGFSEAVVDYIMALEESGLNRTL